MSSIDQKLESQIKKCLRTLNMGKDSGFASGTGFRFVAGKDESVAIYHTDNLPGNCLEIGVNVPIVAMLIKRDQHVLRDWLGKRAQMVNPERVKEKQRGKYGAGMGFRSSQEIVAFLEAFEAFCSERPAKALSRAERIDRLGAEAGFDVEVQVDGSWRLYGSSIFPLRLGVQNFGQEFTVRVSDAGIGAILRSEFSLSENTRDIGWPVKLMGLEGFERLERLFKCAAQLAQSSDQPQALLEGAAPSSDVRPDEPIVTEFIGEVAQRRHQDLFRRKLREYWGDRCPVTGLAVPELLRASHIKPWAACQGEDEGQRLDVFNGLLLAPNIDALFDAYLVTFDEESVMVVAPELDTQSREILGVAAPLRIQKLTPQHQVYLAAHRARMRELHPDAF